MSLASFSRRQTTPLRSYAEVVQRGLDDLAELDIGEPLHDPLDELLIPLEQHLSERSPSPLLRFGEDSPPSPPVAVETVNDDESETEDLYAVDELERITPVPSQPLQGSLYVENAENVLSERDRRLGAHVMPAFSASSLDDLEGDLCDEAYAHGFMIKRRSSRQLAATCTAVRKHYLIFQCIRGGRHRERLDTAQRQREATTRLTDCPYAFKVRLVHVAEGRTRYQVIGHTCAPGSTTHNHPPLDHGSSHLMRRLPEALVEQIRVMSLSPRSPIQIFSHFSALYPDECEVLLLQDIYRHRRHARASQLCGRGAAEHLRQLLLEDAESPQGNILFKLDQREDDSTLESVLWSTRTARALFHRYGKAIAIDITYNANRHNHKILHIAGFTATNQSFTIALAAIPDENEATIARNLRYFNELMGFVTPAVVVIDRATALRNAVAGEWPAPATTILHCQWHVLENLRLYIAEAVVPYRRAAPKREGAAPRPSATQSSTNQHPQGSTERARTVGATQISADASDDGAEGGTATSGTNALAATPNARSLLVEFEGRVLDKEDWDDVKRRVRVDYQALVMYAKTEDEIEAGLETWLEKWSAPPWNRIFATVLEKGLAYADEDGETFIAAHINRSMHLGLRTTSRLEALHASLRPFIGDRQQRRTLTIDKLVLYSLPRFSTQWRELLARMDHEMSTRRAHSTRHLTHAVRTLVSEHALNRISPQVTIAQNIVKRRNGERFHLDGRPIPETQPCTRQFRTSMGLPCAHEIARVLDRASGGSGVLEVRHFDSQWWLSSSIAMNDLKNTIDERVTRASGVIRLDQPAEPGRYRLRDPVAASARRSAQRTRGAQRRPAPATSTGRLLTQAEIADGLQSEPVRPCPACQRRHNPDTHPCRESLAAEAAVRSSANAEDAGERRRRGREPIDFSTIDLPPMYATCRPSEVEGCPFCPANHSRRWCNAMYEWRKWRATREPIPAMSSSPATVEEDWASAISAAESLDAEWRSRSVPATPQRVARTPSISSSSPTPSLDAILANIYAYDETLRTQRVGSIHSELGDSQPRPVSSSPTPTVIPDSQPCELEIVEYVEGAWAPDGSLVRAYDAEEDAEGRKRRRCSP